MPFSSASELQIPNAKSKILARARALGYNARMPSVTLSLGQNSYEVHVANGSLKSVGDFLSRTRISGKAAVISDTNVAPLYAASVLAGLDDAGYAASTHTFPAGEQSKTLATVERLAGELVKAGHDRTSFIVALGGGVVGDLAGFLAATYYRGIPFVQVPSSVMAQVDSSVGGKTAVNIAAGKNLIGAFHQPRLVVADPLTLATLEPRVGREGLAEMVKHAAIARPKSLFPLMQLADELDIGFSLTTIRRLPEIIADNIAVKARIVEQDEHETRGVRAFLNFGHTIGHGIEASVPYGELLHGEVVSLGMRAALHLSRKHAALSAEDERLVINALRSIGLPLTLPEHVDTETVMEHVAADKKFRSGAPRFVLLEAPGRPILSDSVTEADMREALELLKSPA